MTNDPRLTRAFFPSEQSEDSALVPVEDPVELMRRHMGAQPLNLQRVAPLAPLQHVQSPPDTTNSGLAEYIPPAPTIYQGPTHHAPTYQAPTYRGPQYGSYAPVFRPTIVVHTSSKSEASQRDREGGYWLLGLVLIFFLPLVAAILAGGLNE